METIAGAGEHLHMGKVLLQRLGDQQRLLHVVHRQHEELRFLRARRLQEIYLRYFPINLYGG